MRLAGREGTRQGFKFLKEKGKLRSRKTRGDKWRSWKEIVGEIEMGYEIKVRENKGGEVWEGVSFY